MDQMIIINTHSIQQVFFCQIGYWVIIFIMLVLITMDITDMVMDQEELFPIILIIPGQ